MMELKTRNGQFPATLDVPQQDCQFRFQSAAEFTEFIEQELRFLAEHRPASTPRPAFDQAISEAKRIEGFIESDSDEDALAALNQLAKSSGWLFADGWQARVLSEISNQPDLAIDSAYFKLASSAGIRLSGNANDRSSYPRDAMNGGIGSTLALAAAIERTGRKGMQVKRLREELKKALADASELANKALDEVEDLENRKTAYFESMQKAHSDMLSEGKQKLDKTIGECVSETKSISDRLVAEVNALKARLEVHLTTEAPTKYWNDKAWWHGVTASISGAVFLTVLMVGMYLLFFHGASLIASVSDSMSDVQVGIATIALAPLVFITVPILAVAWALRHISRIIIQSLALRSDAKLRASIANSYFAVTEKAAPSEAQALLVLQALFRPIDHREHTEIAPPNLQDVWEMSKPK